MYGVDDVTINMSGRRRTWQSVRQYSQRAARYRRALDVLNYFDQLKIQLLARCDLLSVCTAPLTHALSSSRASSSMTLGAEPVAAAPGLACALAIRDLLAPGSVAGVSRGADDTVAIDCQLISPASAGGVSVVT